MEQNNFASKGEIFVKATEQDQIDIDERMEALRRSNVSRQVNASEEVHGDITTSNRS